MARRTISDVVTAPRVKRTAGTPSFLSRERREGGGSQVPRGDRSSGSGGSIFSALWKWLLLIVILLVLFIIATIVFAKANVKVTPRSEVIDIDTAIVGFRDHEGESLGYQVISMSSEESREVKGAGVKRVERKAEVNVTVYNESGSIKLVKNTRFKSPEGLIYRISEPVVLPAGSAANPSSVEVSIYADEAGSEYNIGKTEFSIPGLVGSASEGKVYAESLSAAAGGFVGETTVVDESDLQEARRALEDSLSANLLESMRESVPEGLVVPEGAYTVSFDFNELGDNEGEEADPGKRRVNLSATLYAAAFDEDDLSAYVASRELVAFSDASVRIINWEELDFSMSDFDAIRDESEIRADISGDARFVWILDTEGLKEDLVGIDNKKSAYEAVFITYPSIERAEVDVRPRWRRSFPKDTDDILVTESLEG